ncbi:site-specific DNA-methyltransferase [Methyloglobulus sp.]|uniref:site-specific DNA-methyltransferase n=1 Tax=Methyloglobulus sp. TaxID=2518622 RepID=UPI0039899539
MPTLDWLNKQDAVRAAQKVPYCLLEAVPELCVGDADSGNMLIQGDNLQALKALLPMYAGKVKCIYIDPPYNTRSAFEHYDDNLEHSVWLGTMYPRLELLRELLAEDGSIWVSIDDNEAHYLKVMMDEVFGRKNFVANAIWQKRISPDNRLRLGGAHDHIIVYCKSPLTHQSFNQLEISESRKKDFKNPDNDQRGPWASTDCTAQAGHGTASQFYTLTTPAGRVIELPNNLCWRFTKERMEEEISAGRIWFGKDGVGVPRKKTYLSEIKGQNAWTWWTNAEVGHNQEAKKEINTLFGADDAFDTPKPERLLKRILEIATNPNDLILDSFLGSGTTAAVAHKTDRRYIGIEMGDHAVTHCQPRLKKVVEGEQGGISQAVNWTGRGGFRFYRLGSEIFNQHGTINANIRFASLAAYIWYMETRTPLLSPTASPLLGVHDGTAYYLLYNGILKDRRPQGGNVLTRAILSALPAHGGKKIIYGESSRLGQARLDANQIIFKQIPYEVKVC